MAKRSTSKKPLTANGNNQPTEILLESPTLPEPGAVVSALLSESEVRRRKDFEAREFDALRAHRLDQEKALRKRLEQAFDRAYLFPNEETEQGRAPCPEGFRRWAERLLAIGVLLRECESVINELCRAELEWLVSHGRIPRERAQLVPGLSLVEPLRIAVGRPAPATMRYACAVLVMAAEGQPDAIAAALEKANIDGELRRFAHWLPFILETVWLPYPNQCGLIPIKDSPRGMTLEEIRQAEQALRRRPFGLPETPADGSVVEARTVSDPSPSGFIPIPADISILTALAKAGRALLHADLVREAAKLVREDAKAGRQGGLVTLSETLLRERIPILLGQGLVARPQGPGGKPTRRKGVGITDAGRDLLKPNA